MTVMKPMASDYTDLKKYIKSMQIADTVLEFNNEFITDKPYTKPEQPNPISKAIIFFLKFN